MTTPMLDLVTSAHMRLSAYPPYQQLILDGFIGTDASDTADAATKVSQGWLFQGLDNDGRPFRDPEGTGKSVVVLSERSQWATANRHNTATFPALQMLIYTDCTRDADGGVLSRDADRRCKHIFKILDRCFHLPLNDDHAWPGSFWVHDSVRGTGFNIGDVPGTESWTVRGEATYDIITD